jgi:hypothetical protein
MYGRTQTAYKVMIIVDGLTAAASAEGLLR